jgi:toxin ParE1/3/4
MQYDVLMTEHAQRDLEELCRYITEHYSSANAAHVLDRIEKALESLSTFPERGSHPKELVTLGIRDYRQTFFKPYRLIYRVAEPRAYVHLIADGRRDMQSLLARRLLAE